MATLYMLGMEAVFFLVMSGLFEYHWHRYDFSSRAIRGMRVAYYGLAFACFAIMIATL